MPGYEVNNEAYTVKQGMAFQFILMSLYISRLRSTLNGVTPMITLVITDLLSPLSLQNL